MSKKFVIITILLFIFLNPGQLFGLRLQADKDSSGTFKGQPKTIEIIKIYTNGYRGIVKDGNITYYSQEGDFLKIKNKEVTENLINSREMKLILEAKVEQYGSNTTNVNVLIGGYSPTAFIGMYGATPIIIGSTWNRNNFTENSIKNVMGNKEGITVVVSYDTHWDYGGPGSSFDKSIEGAFKNLMSQAEFELKNIGMKENKTTITSYSTGHYLGMSYLTDATRGEFNVIRYNVVAPNIRGSVLENNFQIISGGIAYDDMVKNSAYTAIFNSNPYFRDNVDVNVYFTTQDFNQNLASVIYYTSKKDKEAKVKDIINNNFWQVKPDLLKIYLPSNTTHTNEEKIYAQLHNEYLPYYYKSPQTNEIAYYDTKILLEVKRDQLTLQRNIKQNTLSGILKDAPCGAKTTEITVLTNEINSIDQQIAQIEGQISDIDMGNGN